MGSKDSGVGVETEIDVRADGVAGRFRALAGGSGYGVPGHGLRAVWMRRHLQCCVAVFRDEPLAVFGELLRGGAAGALIDADFVAALAAQQHVDGQARGFAGDVPQRVFDAADGCVDHRAAGEAGEVIHGGPQVLDVARVFAYEPAFEILDGGYGGFIGTDGVSFAPAINALVREDLDEAEIASAGVYEERLNVGDLEGRLAVVAGSRLGHGLRLQRETDGTGLEKIAAFHVGIVYPIRLAIVLALRFQIAL